MISSSGNLLPADGRAHHSVRTAQNARRKLGFVFRRAKRQLAVIPLSGNSRTRDTYLIRDLVAPRVDAADDLSAQSASD